MFLLPREIHRASLKSAFGTVLTAAATHRRSFVKFTAQVEIY